MLELIGKIAFGILLLILGYIGFTLYRMYKADPSENVSMMDTGRAGLLSCKKMIDNAKNFFSSENCDR